MDNYIDNLTIPKTILKVKSVNHNLHYTPAPQKQTNKQNTQQK